MTEPYDPNADDAAAPGPAGPQPQDTPEQRAEQGQPADQAAAAPEQPAEAPAAAPSGFAGDQVIQNLIDRGAPQEQIDAARLNLAGQGLVGPPPDSRSADDQPRPEAQP